ncbi:3-dehydroquinate synthase II family protein [Streptomyces fenghuangensis]|uniref:3-dehydroquinate synthase II family protein n=1 Tax=Streptomyces chitinivorans TaxID=1257027 RepID=A0ABW7HXV4_9ACTN|nr:MULTISPECIES: 3-dehydroquinate synthase II [Streptomyces]MCG3043866.1 3-dehydroquinate synthase II [Streptomyces sp. ICN903]MDH2410919.1 3-dehydroquinate synthase II [Streptomyces chitinivorans]
MSVNKLCWLDVRSAGREKKAILEEALHQRVDGVVAEDPADLEALPPSVTRVLLPRGPESLEGGFGRADVVVLPLGPAERAELAEAYPQVEFGRYVEIADAAGLDEACRAARTEKWSVLEFRDPTKIPLEIVIAAAAGAPGSIVTAVGDVEEARVVFGCLELGSDGVMMTARAVGDATELKRAAASPTGELVLTELEVTATAHLGMGERACVDTCSYLRQDEGILVGSHSKGMILCVSETHPLPYMPTRPFRVNAGAIHSYTVVENGRTNYLSELGAGSRVLAVDVAGRTRVVSVGRVKIETRPLISIDAVAPDGRTVNLILQDDWHVRVLGPGGTVLNSTHLEPGDKVLGHLPTADRHVGYPIDEFCLEQ